MTHIIHYKARSVLGDIYQSVVTAAAWPLVFKRLGTRYISHRIEVTL